MHELLTQEAQKELRMRAMSILKEGMKQKDIARVLGVSQTAVTNWKKRAAGAD
ncbi:MAG: helix-turn-helix domain-containing protein [Opitutales bacterium]|nr:helix-turn-helix domain-containing protein [Opitutales bacterium]